MFKNSVIKMDFLSHKQLVRRDILKIITFKDKIWKYGKKSQLNWIRKNLSSNDFHIIYRINNKIIAYANLFVQISSNFQNCVGLGNVSVLPDYRSLGIGSIFLKLIQLQLRINNREAILLCRRELIGFYLKNGFIFVDSTNISPNFSLKSDVFIMSNFPISKKMVLSREF
jgi:N-acetylglutamate synthase-like GNAT family acetyltransferase